MFTHSAAIFWTAGRRYGLASYLSENVVPLRLLHRDEAGVDVVIRPQLQADPAVVN